MAYANSLIRGHGRRNELEADETGAEYMAKLGYDPKEMLSMLSIMIRSGISQKEACVGKRWRHPNLSWDFLIAPEKRFSSTHSRCES